MHDEELMDLFKRLGIGIFVLLVFGILFIVFLYKRFGAEEASILKKFDRSDDFFVLIREKSCKSCGEIVSILKERRVSYFVFYPDRERNVSEIYQRMGIEESDIVAPSIVYFQEGAVHSILVDVQNISDLKEFIDYNQLGK